MGRRIIAKTWVSEKLVGSDHELIMVEIAMLKVLSEVKNMVRKIPRPKITHTKDVALKARFNNIIRGGIQSTHAKTGLDDHACNI